MPRVLLALRHGGSASIRARPTRPRDRAAHFYDDLTGRLHNGVIAGGSIKTFVFWVVTFGVNICLVFRGISKGIEKFAPGRCR